MGMQPMVTTIDIAGEAVEFAEATVDELLASPDSVHGILEARHGTDGTQAIIDKLTGYRTDRPIQYVQKRYRQIAQAIANPAGLAMEPYHGADRMKPLEQSIMIVAKVVPGETIKSVRQMTPSMIHTILTRHNEMNRPPGPATPKDARERAMENIDRLKGGL